MDTSLGNISASCVSRALDPVRLARRAPSATAIITLTVLALLALVLLLSSHPAEATITGDLPPSSGDWVVDDPTVARGETIVLRGNLSVGSSLVLEGCEVRLEPTSDGGLGVNVTPDGTLVANHTRFTSWSGHTYTFLVHGRMSAKGATFEDGEGGVRILTDKVVTIANSYIINPTGVGLYLEDANGTRVSNLLVRSDGRDVYANFTVDAVTNGGTYVLKAPSWKAVEVLGGSPHLADLAISFNGTVYTNVTIVLRSVQPQVKMNCDWVFLDVDTGEPLDLSGIVLRDSTLGATVSYHIDNRITNGAVNILTAMTGMLVRLHNYRNVTLSNLAIIDLVREEVAINYTQSGLPSNVVPGLLDKGVTLVGSLVDETLTGQGPYSYKLHVRDIVSWEVGILDNRILPTYSGDKTPSFYMETVVDNVTASDWQNLIYYDLGVLRYGDIKKHIDTHIRISNSTFTYLRGSVVHWDPFAPTYDPRPVSLGNYFLVENCTFDLNTVGDDGLFWIPNLMIPGKTNTPSRGGVFRNNVFTRNYGKILHIGSMENIISPGTEWTVIENNTFIGNVAAFDTAYTELFTIYGRDRVRIADNTFRDTQCFIGFLIGDGGGELGHRDPCLIQILDNTFDGNRALNMVGGPNGFFEILWGGHLEVAGNDVSRSGTRFMNLTEFPEFTRYSSVDFHHNTVHDIKDVIVYFPNNDTNHTLLTAHIRDNKIWNLTAPFTDCNTEGTDWWMENFDAVIHVYNNTITNATSTALRLYGNLTVANNTFIDCGDWAVQLVNIYKHQPKLYMNTFRNCTNALWVGGKYFTLIEALIWIRDMEIDCTGTAMYFSRMEATLERINITDNASVAIVADRSYVDAYDCYMEEGSARVIMNGWVRIWFNVEAWVEWANAEGEASGNPVPVASVTFYNTTGSWSASGMTNDSGHLEPFPLMRWYMTMSPEDFAIASPYTVMARNSSFVANMSLELNRSYKGAEALVILLVDPVLPDLALDSPFDDTAVNTTYLVVRGMARDLGSGVLRVELTLVGGGTAIVNLTRYGEFQHTFTDIPEGTVLVEVRVLDVALNERTVGVSVLVDRTPPWLILHSPADGAVTNRTTVRVLGAYERGAEVWVNIVPVAGSSGLLDLVLNLIEGRNRITVTATDALGNTARVSVNVTLDTVPPELELLVPKDGLLTSARTVDVEGYVHDHSVLMYTVLRRYTDQRNETFEAGPDGFFSHPVPLEEGENVIIVAAKDLAGNVAFFRRVVTSDTVPPFLEITSPEDGLLTNAREVRLVARMDADATVYLNGNLQLNPGFMNKTLYLSEGENVLELRAVDQVGNEAVAVVTVTLDTVAPMFDLTLPAEDHTRTREPRFKVSGRVSSDTEYLTVQGAAVRRAFDGSFVTTVFLPADGTHTIIIEAWDRAGNSARLVRTVELDTTPPGLFVTYLPAGDVIKDERGVLEVRVATNEDADLVELVHNQVVEGWHWSVNSTLEGTTTFVQTLHLLEGPNQIWVSVSDDLGNTNTTLYMVTYRHNPPSDVSSIDDAVYYLVILLVCIIAAVAAYVKVRRVG